MTPSDILTAARANPLSPIVPAREEWLRGWIGPILLETDHVPYVVVASFLRFDGVPTFVCAWCTNPSVIVNAIAEHIRLDLRRPEVRDRLVRCGAPPIVRDSVAAALTWVLTGRDIMAGLRDLPEEVLTPRDDGWYIPLPHGAVGWLPRQAA